MKRNSGANFMSEKLSRLVALLNEDWLLINNWPMLLLMGHKRGIILTVLLFKNVLRYDKRHSLLTHYLVENAHSRQQVHLLGHICNNCFLCPRQSAYFGSKRFVEKYFYFWNAERWNIECSSYNTFNPFQNKHQIHRHIQSVRCCELMKKSKQSESHEMGMAN